MGKLYNYIKRKLFVFENMSEQEFNKSLSELKQRFRKFRSKMLLELISLKVEDDYCHFFEFIIAFNLLDPKLQLRHKFAFILDKIKEEKGLDLHKTMTVTMLANNPYTSSNNSISFLALPLTYRCVMYSRAAMSMNLMPQFMFEDKGMPSQSSIVVSCCHSFTTVSKGEASDPMKTRIGLSSILSTFFSLFSVLTLNNESFADPK